MKLNKFKKHLSFLDFELKIISIITLILLLTIITISLILKWYYDKDNINSLLAEAHGFVFELLIIVFVITLLVKRYNIKIWKPSRNYFYVILLEKMDTLLFHTVPDYIIKWKPKYCHFGKFSAYIAFETEESNMQTEKMIEIIMFELEKKKDVLLNEKSDYFKSIYKRLPPILSLNSYIDNLFSSYSFAIDSDLSEKLLEIKNNLVYAETSLNPNKLKKSKEEIELFSYSYAPIIISIWSLIQTLIQKSDSCVYTE